MKRLPRWLLLVALLLSPLAVAQLSAALSDNLVACWTLDEASGTRNDSVGTNHLTDNNTVTTGTAKVGTNAAQFTNANSESLSIADNAALSTGDIDYTVCAWVNLDTLGGLRNIASKYSDPGGSGNEEWQLFWGHSGIYNRFVFRVTTSTEIVADTFGVPSTGTYYAVCGVHDAGANQIRISVNGSNIDQTSHSGGSPDSAAKFSLGTLDGGQFMDGRLDEVAFWKQALDSTELAAYYNSGTGVSCSSMTGGAAETKKLLLLGVGEWLFDF